MTDSPAPAGDIPDFAALAADPEIAPLLRFEPVVRQVKRPNGWTPELQRELIARLAATGTLQAAVWQMGKHATGAEALYKSRSTDSFRLSWDAALLIGRRRNGLDVRPPFAGQVPGITRRTRARDAMWGQPLPLSGQARNAPEEQDGTEEQKIELLERIANKFLRKVAQERTARLSGEIVAADFYLRQITMIEVSFDLLTSELGFNASEYLRRLRRGEHELLDIVDTPWVRFLDTKRREYWLSDPSEPPRPILFKDEFVEDHGDHRTQPSHSELGGCTAPARGYDAKQWKAMTGEQQRSAREKQYEEDAAEQLAWEAQARREYESRRESDGRP